MNTATKDKKNRDIIPEPSEWWAAIRDERIRRGLTQHEFANQVGMDQRNLARLERGNNGHIPKSEFIYRLIAEHGFPLELFYPGDAIVAAADRLE